MNTETVFACCNPAIPSVHNDPEDFPSWGNFSAGRTKSPKNTFQSLSEVLAVCALFVSPQNDTDKKTSRLQRLASDEILNAFLRSRKATMVGSDY